FPYFSLYSSISFIFKLCSANNATNSSSLLLSYVSSLSRMLRILFDISDVEFCKVNSKGALGLRIKQSFPSALTGGNNSAFFDTLVVVYVTLISIGFFFSFSLNVEVLDECLFKNVCLLLFLAKVAY